MCATSSQCWPSVENETVVAAGGPSLNDGSTATMPRSDAAKLLAEEMLSPVVGSGGPHVGSGPGGQVGPAGGGGGPVR